MTSPAKAQRDTCPRASTNLPLLSILGLDRLDANNDLVAGGDGIFDYIEGLTVISTLGTIIFPYLQPFGNDLDSLAFKGPRTP